MDLPVLSPDELMTEYIAKIMLRYARKVRHFPRVKFAKARIATALLLSEGNDEDHDKALQFYTANIVDKSTPGPEKFYSLLGSPNTTTARLEMLLMTKRRRHGSKFKSTRARHCNNWLRKRVLWAPSSTTDGA